MRGTSIDFSGVYGIPERNWVLQEDWNVKVAINLERCNESRKIIPKNFLTIT